MTNKPQGTLYVGVTNDLSRRLCEHQQGLVSSFTSKYKLKCLVYFEETHNVNAAIEREKQLKNWHRQWKINLIEELNPAWEDLSRQWELQQTLKQVQGDKSIWDDAE